MESGFHVRTRLTASISPSEDPDKVLAAATNIVGGCAYQAEKGDYRISIVSTEVACLRKFHDQLRDRHVRDAARRLLTRNRDGDTTSVLLNRQAAYAGVIVLCSSEQESPLGPIVLELASDKLDDVISWLTAY